MNISIKDLLKCSKNIKTELISSNNVDWVAKVSGEYKEMKNNEKGFNNTQIKQLVSIIKEVIHQEVPPIVEEIIDKKVPKMINELVPPIIDQKLEPIKNDINQLKRDVEHIKQEAKNHNWNIC